MTTILLVLATVLAPAAGTSPLPGASPARESLRFAPQAGTTLVKSLYVGHDLKLDQSGLSRDGGALVRDPLQSVVSTGFRLTIQDQYLEVAGGLPLRMLRTYTTLSGTGKLSARIGQGGRRFEDEAALGSPLRDFEVELTWVPEEADWSRAWARWDAEESWLAGIQGDTDLLAVLPAQEVAEGDRWELPAEVVRSLLAPGGNHLLTPTRGNVFGRSVEVGIGGDFADVLEGDLGGLVTARFAGVREEEGVRLGVIELEIQGLVAVTDRTDLWRTSMPLEEKREGRRLLSALLEYGLDARGELKWDLGAGHFHSLDLAGDERYVLNVSKEEPSPEGLARIDIQNAMSGTMLLRYAVRPPQEDEGR